MTNTPNKIGVGNGHVPFPKPLFEVDLETDVRVARRVCTACACASMAARMGSRSIPTKTGRSLRRASASWTAVAVSESVTGPSRVTIPPISPSMPGADQFDQGPDLPRPKHANGRVAGQELSSSIAVP